MPGLPLISGDEFVKSMPSGGYNWERTVGRHVILVDSEGTTLSVRRHRELGEGLLRRLVRDAGLAADEFLELLG